MRGVVCRWIWLLAIATGSAQPLPEFDFTQPSGAQGWIAAHDISQFSPTTNGLLATILGTDPYLTGPARDYPASQSLWAKLRLRSDQAGTCQLFYYTTAPSEAASVVFTVPAGVWVEGRVPLPALGANYRIRIDPPGTGGQVTLSSLRFEARGALPDFDFATIPDATQWGAPNDLQILFPTTDGLPLRITGSDPYFSGPPRDYPPGQLLWMRLRLKSDQGGTAQLFYFQTGAAEENSVRFNVVGGTWEEVLVPLPALLSATRLRFDPPGIGGTCVVSRLRFELRPVLQEPSWIKPVPPNLTSNTLTVSSGALTLVHGSEGLGAFAVRVNGETVAIGNTRSMIGYTKGVTQRWMTVTNPVSLQTNASVLQATVMFTDTEGAEWRVEQSFWPAAAAGAIELESRVMVNQDREVIFLPMFTLLPGVGSFGTNKSQAMLAGVEYLENEPSSSEADVTGPGSRRQVPDALKLTFPLMALSAASNYVGLLWNPGPDIAALHDSPDRIFKSDGHLMALLYPGAAPEMREDGRVLPYAGKLLRSGQALLLRATILGGRGNTVIPAVQEYVSRRGLPAVPNTGYTASNYFTLTAHAWLDSQIRDGLQFRHAVGSGFGSAPAADAALYMDWLSTRIVDASLRDRLINTARDARALVSPPNYNFAAVGHVRFPVETLVYGYVPENAAAAYNDGVSQVNTFQPDGAILYQPPVTGNDLGRTHWSREANGLTATRVALVLERGVFSGNRDLINDGLRLLRALNKFRDTVPRGAQTWEVPLHTPDILASAYLVRAYTLGYELTGENDFFQQARYWAWTGVPFLYLAAPNDRPVGVYSTIPVLGATQFVAPLWIGLPVQWCGLVYGNAVRRFARHDPGGPWAQIADGIAAAGLQQTHTVAEPAYQGLLPDSFELRSQVRNPVPINPATLLPEAIQMFDADPVYDFRSFRHHRLLVHAPGVISGIRESSDRLSFRVGGWSRSPWYVLVNGLGALPRVKLDGIETAIQLPHQFQPVEGRLILRLNAPTEVELAVPAFDALRIERKGDGTMKIGWPVGLTNYSLERVSPLDAVWEQANGVFAIEGVSRVFKAQGNASAEFFRLRQQP